MQRWAVASKEWMEWRNGRNGMEWNMEWMEWKWGRQRSESGSLFMAILLWFLGQSAAKAGADHVQLLAQSPAEFQLAQSHGLV